MLTNTHTNKYKQIPLKTSNVLRYATTLGNQNVSIFARSGLNRLQAGYKLHVANIVDRDAIFVHESIVVCICMHKWWRDKSFVVAGYIF